MSTKNSQQAKSASSDKKGSPESSEVKQPRGYQPIVLSSQRYEKILNNSVNVDMKKQQLLDEEMKQLEIQKAGNDEIVSKFVGNMQRTQEQKLQQIQEELDRKTAFARESFEQTKENEAQKRRDKIAKAQQLMEMLKPGPRELHTAVLQSEVLRARNVQRDINHEFKKATRKQECETKNRCEGQAMAWIYEDQQRLAERQKNENNYKRELLQTINENQRQKAEQKKQSLKEQIAARDATDAEIQAQIEKQKSIMEKKRATLRKNALEAMKMVEQRRMREDLGDTLENRLCCVYNTGKRQIDAMITEQSKQLAANQQKRVDEEVKRLSAIEDKALAVESERIRRDITTMQLKFTAEEQEKVRKDKAAKQARIEAYLNEMEAQKQAQFRATEEKRFDMAQRFKNAEVNKMFAQREQQDLKTNAQNVRSYLDKQIQDNQRNKIARKMAIRECNSDIVEKEHQFFFDYARELIDDAHQKGRPLYPFVKAVRHYKKENQLDNERKVPKHLETQVSFVPCQTQPKECTAKKPEKEDTMSAATRENILKNCLKIDEIIIKSIKEEEAKQAKAAENKSTLTKREKLDDDCISESSSVKLRYSMDDLKKLNRFAAPSCH